MKPLLQNRTQLAKALGVSRTTLYAMEAAGAPFPSGRSNVEWLSSWLKANPKFRPKNFDGKIGHVQTEEATLDEEELNADATADRFHGAWFTQDIGRINKQTDRQLFVEADLFGQQVYSSDSFDKTYAVVHDLKGNVIGVFLRAKE